MFLPAQHDPDAFAAFQVLKYLEQQRRASLPIGGFTYSRLRPPVFSGAWYSDNATNPGWMRESVTQLIFDIQVDVADQDLIKMLGRLRSHIAKIYTENGSPQEEFWIMCHPVIQLIAS